MLSGWWAVLPRWWAEGARGAKGRRLLSHWRSLGQLLSLLLLLLLPLLLPRHPHRPPKDEHLARLPRRPYLP